jgi:quercetin dioxygenase-like cupin family protein
MPLDKPPVPCHELDVTTGWEPAPGAAPGVEQKMLSGALDEAAQVGVRTRLIRFLPGAHVDARFVHEYWEEVYILEGELALGGGGYGPQETFGPHSYACRPPGTPHGPFRSDGGCLFLEIQYFA